MQIIPNKVRTFLNPEPFVNVFIIGHSSLCLFTPNPGLTFMQFLEMLKQKTANFGLTRENANLKSQLESLQNRIECFKLGKNNEEYSKQILGPSIKDNIEGMIENKDEDTKKQLDYNASLHMQEWTDITDENFRLKAELMKYG